MENERLDIKTKMVKDHEAERRSKAVFLTFGRSGGGSRLRNGFIHNGALHILAASCRGTEALFFRYTLAVPPPVNGDEAVIS